MPKDAEVQEAVSLYAALAKAQAEMTPALKDTSNPHFKTKYADLASVQDASLSALRKHGFAVFQPLGRDEHGLHVRTVLAHESGETLECAIPLVGFKQDMQGLGSAITYARRYGLLCMSGVAPEDDDGNASKPAARQPDYRQEIANEPKAGPRPQDRDAETKARLGGAMSEEALKIAWQWVWAAYGAQPPDWAWKMKDDAKANLAKTAPADPNEPPF